MSRRTGSSGRAPGSSLVLYIIIYDTVTLRCMRNMGGSFRVALSITAWAWLISRVLITHLHSTSLLYSLATSFLVVIDIVVIVEQDAPRGLILSAAPFLLTILSARRPRHQRLQVRRTDLGP